MNFTDAQNQAISQTGGSVLVSAAAGSGKTSVLAERCSYLVIKARDRCSIDKLLVLTFAEAAANEMRGRIEQAISRHYLEALQESSPEADYLKRQAMLAPAAHISTIHAFCARLIRQNFHLAALDPSFRVLDGAEAQLLREEVAQALFEEQLDGPSGDALRQLIDLYGDGSDGELRDRVMQTYETTRGICQPALWRLKALAALEEAAGTHALRDSRLGRDYLELIKRELRTALAEACAIGEAVAKHSSPGPYATQAKETILLIEDCIEKLGAGKYDLVSAILQQGLPSNLRGKHGIPPEAAKSLQDRFKRLRTNLFDEKGAIFPLVALSEQRLIEDVGRTLPCARAFLGLVQDFTQRYHREKSAGNALDFADLEHTALALLGTPDAAGKYAPSELARRMHGRYAHVLVDEYQDINPVQEEILRLASRECLRDEGVRGNLFCVGDVKQSIYRFRLAEPRLFLDRRGEYQQGKGGEAIDLRENFRTRWPLLQAINGVFRRLMTASAAEIEYTAGHEFASTMEYPVTEDGFAGTPVELHLLDRDELMAGGDEEADGESGDEEELEMAEMEARHVADLVRKLLVPPDGKARQVYDPREKRFRPIEPNDIAVLLRSTRQRTREFAQAFARSGIPMRSESRSGFFKAVEVQDVLALLKVLDNQQQDIPLAAVLRSPIARLEAPEDALVEIACAYREIPFHQAVAKYAQEQNDALAEKLRTLLDRVAVWRLVALQRSTEELIATIYRETSLPAWYSALPNGQQRLANLQYLHQCAGKFAHFSRQGLYRFLCYLEDLEERDSLAQPPAGNDGQAVKLMTVHAAKGLEYPVVIVAGLGSKLNLTDSRQTVLIHRERGLAMRVADVQSNTRYPGIASHVIAAEITRASLAEELRVLYVALTRAREHLILVGSAAHGQLERWQEMHEEGPLPDHRFLAGKSFLDWLAPVFFSARKGDLKASIIATLPKPPERGPVAKAGAKSLLGPSGTGPLHPLVQQAILRLNYRYPWAKAAGEPAAVSVTALSKQPAMAPVDADSNEPDVTLPFEPPAFATSGELTPGDDAATRGTAMHLVMEHLDLTLPLERLGEQIRQMVDRGVLDVQQASLITEADIAWFLQTPTGELLRASAQSVLRELPFLDAITPQGCENCAGMDRVMLRGRIDAVLPLDGGWLVLDYKTDRVAPEPGGERMRAYQQQVSLYRNAVERSGLGRVAGVRLVLLRARQILEL